MRLTSIFLYPDLGEFKSDAALAFRNQARSVCHYVQRFIAARKVQADGFNRICIVCKHVASETTYVNSCKVLSVEVSFDMAEYERTAKDDLQEYFIELLEAGLSKCCRDHPLPAALFGEAIESFRAHGYKNQWVHSAKTFRALGLKCKLLCELDLSAFHLRLEVERDGKPFFSQEILNTLADEVVYAHRFKDVKLDGQTLLVQDKFGRSFFELDVA